MIGKEGGSGRGRERAGRGSCGLRGSAIVHREREMSLSTFGYTVKSYYAHGSRSSHVHHDDGCEQDRARLAVIEQLYRHVVAYQ